MAITALYRINGGEVVKISPRGQSFVDRNTAMWGVLTDPTFPDGQVIRTTLLNGNLGPLKVLGLAKFADVGGNSVRLATQAEIDAFVVGDTEDEKTQDATQAEEMLITHPVFRKIFAAFERDLEARVPGLAARTKAAREAALRAAVDRDD